MVNTSLSKTPASHFGCETKDGPLPPLPPRWVFEGFKWEDNYLNYVNVLNDARKLKEHSIPYGTIIIERPWSTAYNSWIFAESFHQTSEIAPGKKLVDELHSMGYRVMVWTVPYINNGTDSPNSYDLKWEKETFDYGDKRGYFLKETTSGSTAIRRWWRGCGGLIDFTSLEAIQWWHSLMDPIFDIVDVDGMQADHVAGFGDVLYGKEGKISFRKYEELYYQDMQRYVTKKTDGKGLVMHRPDIVNTYYGGSTHLKNQITALAIWTGDPENTFDAYRRSVIGIYQLNTEERYPYSGADIAGHMGDFNRELFLRWSQFACFCPLFIHNRLLWEGRVRLPADSVGDVGNAANDPGIEKDEEALRIHRYYATLHQELVPYSYSYAHICHRKGMGIIHNPGLNRDISETYEYLYGTEILVAPIVEPKKDKRDVCLPEGEWIDYWTAKMYKGEETLSNYPASLERIPIFIRKGAIIPMEVSNEVTNHGTSYSQGYLTLDIYPASESRFDFYSGEAESEPCILTVEEKRDTVVIDLKPNPIKSILRVLTRKPNRIQINNQNIGQIEKSETFWINKENCWWFDLEQKRAYIKIHQQKPVTVVMWV